MADNNAVASVSAVMTMESSSFSAAQRKMLTENARLRAALKATGAGVDAVAAGTKRFQRVTAEAGHSMVAPWMASSAALRVMEGNITNNIRAGERFLATFKPIQGVLTSAFPVIGAVALVGVVSKLIERIDAFNKKMNRMPETIDIAFRPMISEARKANDEMQLSTDLIDNQIAKMEGKPQNNLAIALDDARINADALGESLFKDMEVSRRLLKENKIGFVASVFSGKASMSDVSGSIQSFQDQLDSIGQQIVIDAHNNVSKDKASADQKALADKKLSYLKYLYTQIAIASPSDLTYMPRGMVDMKKFQASQMFPSTEDQSSKLMVLRRELDYQLETAKTPGLQKKHDKAVSVKNAFEAARALALAYQQAAREVTRLTRSTAKLTASTEAIKAKWDEIATGDVSAKANMGKPRISNYDLLLQSGKDTADYVKAYYDSNSIRNANTFNLSSTMDKISLKSGAISSAQYMRRAAARHTAEYQFQSSQIHAASAATLADTSLTAIHRKARLQQLQNQSNQAAGMYRIVHMQDQWNLQMLQPLGAVQTALMQFAQQVTNVGSVLSNFAMGTLTSVNGAIGAAAAGQHNTFRGFGRSMIAGSTTMGLNALEGYGIKGLFGKSMPKKADGYHVFVDNFPKALKGVGAAGKSVIGGLGGKLLGKMNDSNFFSSIMGGKLFGSGSLFGGSGASGVLSAASTFLPMLGFAGGGSPPLHRLSMVGEHGPELFNPGGVRGTIIPNHALGGSSTVNIDARATNPAMVQSAVMRGMALAYAGAVHTSATQQSDAARRKP